MPAEALAKAGAFADASGKDCRTTPPPPTHTRTHTRTHAKLGKVHDQFGVPGCGGASHFGRCNTRMDGAWEPM